MHMRARVKNKDVKTNVHEERLGVQHSGRIKDRNGGVEKSAGVRFFAIRVKCGQGEGEIVTSQLRIEEESILKRRLFARLDDGVFELRHGEVQDVVRILLRRVERTRDVRHIDDALARVAHAEHNLDLRCDAMGCGVCGGEKVRPALVRKQATENTRTRVLTRVSSHSERSLADTKNGAIAIAIVTEYSVHTTYVTVRVSLTFSAAGKTALG